MTDTKALIAKLRRISGGIAVVTVVRQAADALEAQEAKIADFLSDENVEKAAHAFVDARYPGISWRLISESRKEFYRNASRAALSAVLGKEKPDASEIEASNPLPLDPQPWKCPSDTAICRGTYRDAHVSVFAPRRELGYETDRERYES